MIQCIEVSFAVPVELSHDQLRRIAEVIEEVARAHTPAGCVHWLSGTGHKPRLSPTDAAFLGKPDLADPTIEGEPEFDDSVLYFETHCREDY